MKLSIHTLAALALLSLPICGEAGPAIKIQPGVAQLFIDDVMIAQQSGLRRTLHQPAKDNDGNTPLIAARAGTTLLAYGSIVRDTRLNRYVMFVQELPSRQMYRLTSADGLDWQPNTHDQLERVSLDLSFPPLPPDARGQPGIDLFSCYYDTTDAERPYKGWVWAANVGNEWEGIWYVDSADGLRWHKGRQIFSGFAGEGDPSCRVITQDGRTLYGPGDVTLFAHDPVENRFLGLFKFYSPRDLAPDYGSRARAYAFLDGMDRPFDIQKLNRIQLMPAMAARNGDAPADEYYASTAWRYESLWLGGLKIFHGRDRLSLVRRRLRLSQAGRQPGRARLAQGAVHQQHRRRGSLHSQRRRGRQRRAPTTAATSASSARGPCGSATNSSTTTPPPPTARMPPRDHRLTGGGIFRARLRRDGFVSVDSGTLTTPLLEFKGRELMLNAVGPVKVQVLDESGKTRASAAVKGDSVRHPSGLTANPCGR